MPHFGVVIFQFILCEWIGTVEFYNLGFLLDLRTSNMFIGTSTSTICTVNSNLFLRLRNVNIILIGLLESAKFYPLQSIIWSTVYMYLHQIT